MLQNVSRDFGIRHSLFTIFYHSPLVNNKKLCILDLFSLDGGSGSHCTHIVWASGTNRTIGHRTARQGLVQNLGRGRVLWSKNKSSTIIRTAVGYRKPWYKATRVRNFGPETDYLGGASCVKNGRRAPNATRFPPYEGSSPHRTG